MKRIVITGLIAFGVAATLGFLLSFVPDLGQLGVILPAVVGVLIAFMWWSLSGNKKVIKVNASDRSQALGALPPDGQAVVWVYREGFVGKAVGLNVSVDGRDVAQLKSPASTRIVLAPGAYTLGAAMGVGGSLSPNAASAPINPAAGETLVFQLSMKMGALKNTLTLDAKSDVAGALQRLATTPMVQPLAAGA